MSLDAHVVAVVGALAIDVELAVPDDAVVAVLGPNGAGKTTILRAVAGLHRLDGGRIELHGRVLADPAAGVDLPPEHRDIGFVFQDRLLFEHLSAVDNVAFGLRARGHRREAARREAHQWLERFGVAAQTGQRPAALSGGEAQRVALARALATRPQALLLDEPLAALDASVRPTVRAELRRHLRETGGPRVLVTHDPVDALVLADRIVVVEDGRVTHAGPPLAVARAPRTSYVADLMGLNLYAGTRRGMQIDLADGGTLTVADEGPDGGVLAAVAPEAVALYRSPPDGSPRNAWPVTVADVQAARARVRVVLAGTPSIVAEVTPDAIAALGLVPGASVWVVVKATEITTYPS